MSLGGKAKSDVAAESCISDTASGERQCGEQQASLKPALLEWMGLDEPSEVRPNWSGWG